MEYRLVCQFCGKDFIANNKNKKYCNNDHEFNCSICNKKFILSKNQFFEVTHNLNNEIVCSNNCLQQKKKNHNILKYGKPTYNNKEQIKKTIQEKYGVENISQLDSIKQKKKDTLKKNYNTVKDGYAYIKNKTKQTKLIKYKDKNYNNRNKCKKTCLEKYGVENVSQVDTTIQKVKQTKQDRYGNSNYNNMKKNRQTCMKRYGVSSVLSLASNIKLRQQTNLIKYHRFSSAQVHISDEAFSIISNELKFKSFLENNKENLSTAFLCNKLGISDNTFLTYYHKYNCEKLYPLHLLASTLETDIMKLLDNYSIKYKHQDRKEIYPKELDIFIKSKNLAIECNGTYWHSSMKGFDSKYHYNKSKLCEEKGIRLIHIWEYEWYNNRQRPILENIIKNALGINENKLYARKLDIEVRPSNIMREFFDKNNIQGFRGR